MTLNIFSLFGENLSFEIKDHIYIFRYMSVGETFDSSYWGLVNLVSPPQGITWKKMLIYTYYQFPWGLSAEYLFLLIFR